MKRARLVLYGLPVLAFGVALVAQFVLDQFGADCQGAGLDADFQCNTLGKVQIGIVLAAWVSIVCWGVWMLGLGIRFVLKRQRPR